MEDITVKYFPSLFDRVNNEEKYEFYSYRSDKNEQDACDSHDHIVSLIKKFIEFRLLISVLSSVWQDSYSSAKQYRWDIAIYLMVLL